MLSILSNLYMYIKTYVSIAARNHQIKEMRYVHSLLKATRTPPSVKLGL